MRVYFCHVVVLSGLAFLFHFAWESIQCTIFFVHGSFDASWWGMLVAALGDIGLTWVIYIIVAMISRRWRWAHRPWRPLQLFTFILTALALGIAVELRALDEGRWRYTSLAPLVPLLGVSIVPLLQVLLLTPLIVKIAERICPVEDPV